MRRLPPLTATGALALAIVATATWAITRPDPVPATPATAVAVDASGAIDARERDDGGDARGEFEAWLAEEAPEADEIAPERVAMERVRGASDDRERASGRATRPGSGRWHRERYETLARSDAARFATAARERIGSDAALAEKVALLAVADRHDAALAGELWASAFDPGRTDDDPLPDAALLLLTRAAPDSPIACERLWSDAVTEPRLPARRRWPAALAMAAHADAALLESATPRIFDETDAEVRTALLRGLLRNESPAAQRLFRELALAAAWQDEARVVGLERERRDDGLAMNSDGG